MFTTASSYYAGCKHPPCLHGRFQVGVSVAPWRPVARQKLQHPGWTKVSSSALPPAVPRDGGWERDGAPIGVGRPGQRAHTCAGRPSGQQRQRGGHLTQSAFINKKEDADGEFPGTFPRFTLTPLALPSSSDPGEIRAIICIC